jgi:outer membrane receptor protein involved in Fe transport
VNRPEFRELAPFLFYDYKLESSRVGNPNLKTANIDNLDFRYENYPRPGETFSFGVFYKRFTNPIEDRLIVTTEQSSLTFVNADFAYAYGAEIELKKSLKNITSSTFLDKISINLNASYIFSRVDLGETATAQDRVRSLQGQAPYIVNAALYYTNNAKQINASVIYNIYGRNIFAVGDVSFPTMFELERNSLDLTVSKTLKGGVVLKGAVQNILDAPYRFYQDSNRNGAIDDIDHVIINFRRGTLVTFSVQFDLIRDKSE